MMAGIRGRDTGPEKEIRSALHRLGLRFRTHVRDLPGKPDIVLPKWNAVIEVHGCFWHRHEGCRLSAQPEDRTGAWKAKFDANVARDRRNRATLDELGWRVAIVWECAVRDRGAQAVAGDVLEWLATESKYAEFGL
jgi:DNA mismatch endonuclease (patch repair protein)